MRALVGKTMHDTFGGMFGWPLQPAANAAGDHIRHPVRSHVLLREKEDISVDVVLDFDGHLLTLAGADIYPDEMRGTPEMHADMAAEIANIIAGGIKAYLNQSGHQLRMVEQSTAPPASDTAAPPVVDVSFRYETGAAAKPLGVVVHIRLQDFPLASFKNNH